MKVKSYKSIIPGENGEVENLDRNDYMTAQYIEMCDDYLSKIELSGRCAFLYVGGVTLSASEARNKVGANESTLAIKELAAFSLHRWIGRLKDRDKISYANISANTCASSMYSLYEAERLFDEGFDEVVIVAEEMTSFNTRRVFAEHKIDIKLGEGLAILHLTKDGDGTEITDTKWTYSYDRNPFGTSVDGYGSVATDADMVKVHGTGTENNEAAEQVAFEGMKQIRFKDKIGHTQGASGLIELCMVLDEDYYGKILCISSGLGGFYGSCVVHK